MLTDRVCIIHAGKIRIVGCLTSLLILLACGVAMAADRSNDSNLPPVSKPTADHGRFEALKAPMGTGPDVTNACISCHTEAAKQVQGTFHWNWEKKTAGKGAMGKAHILNNF